MPGKYKTKRKLRRKPARKYKKSGGTTLINRSLQPFASRFITKMKYSEAFNFNALNNYTQIMRLNSVFDPNSAVGGHQPYGFDQLTPIYNRYRVISCSYVINCFTSGAALRFGALPCNDSPPINGMSELCENPRARWKLQYPGGGTSVVMGRVSIPSLVGRTKSQYMADDRFQAEVTTNPQEAALLYVTGQRIDDGSAEFQGTITLEYTVEFFDPKPIDQS